MEGFSNFFGRSGGWKSLQEVKSEPWKEVQPARVGEEAEGRGARAAESRRGDQPGQMMQGYETGKCFRCFLWVCPGSFSPVSLLPKTLFIIFQGQPQGCSTAIW